MEVGAGREVVALRRIVQLRSDGQVDEQADPAAVRRVLDEPDPVEAGIATAAREARALLGIPGVTGVNISGAASARGYEFAAQVKAELAGRIREEREHDP